MLLRDVAKEDFFETKYEEKAEMEALGSLMSAVDELNNEISYCDKEIQKWQENKRSIKDRFLKILNGIG
jgi:hypothetical protein